jgi:hypothetical protein
MASTETENRRVMYPFARGVVDPFAGRRGVWLEEEDGHYVRVRWDDGIEESVWGADLLDLNQAALDRLCASYDRPYVNLKDIDREAAELEAAAGRPVRTS